MVFPKQRLLWLIGLLCLIAGGYVVGLSGSKPSADRPPQSGEPRFWQWARQAGTGKLWFGRTAPTAVVCSADGRAFVSGYITGHTDWGELVTEPQYEHASFVATYAPDGSLHGVKLFGGTGAFYIMAMAGGPEGDLFVTAQLSRSILTDASGTVQLGDSTYRTMSENDLIVARLSPEGQIRWVWQAGGNPVQYSFGSGIAVDNSGNTYVIGTFKGAFGLMDEISQGEEDIFVAKFDPHGVLEWIWKAGGPLSDSGRAVAVDASGNIRVFGIYEGTASFGMEQRTAKGKADWFLAALTPDGTLKWLQTGGGRYGVADAVAVDSLGASYIAGGFGDTLSIGQTQLISRKKDAFGYPDQIFVAKFDSSGTPVWSFQAGGMNGSDGADAIAVDREGVCYVTGSFVGPATFGSFKLQGRYEREGRNAIRDRNMFVAKFRGDGTLLWVHQSTGDKKQFAKGVTIGISDSGIGYVAGEFDQEIAFGDTTLSGFPSYNLFLVRFDADFEKR